VNAIRSGRRAPSTVAAGDEPRVNCHKKIAAQGLLAPVLRDEVQCATDPGRAHSGANEWAKFAGYSFYEVGR
jgi:hypothetical protein